MQSAADVHAHSPHDDDVDDTFIEELPKASFFDSSELRQWKGIWLMPPLLKAAAAFQKRFAARDDDVLLASTTKTGTTWLKALTFCITTTRGGDSLAVERENPHILVPTVESATLSMRPGPFDVYGGALGARLLHTHLQHALLPESVKNSNCRIVYMARNPNDTIISSWHFFNSVMRKDRDPFPLEEYVDCFCYGAHIYGPFVEHLAAYWEESKKRPDKILFLKYEELKQDPKREVMKIAEFLGKPFEDEGEADEIVRRCSLEKLKNSEVNKSGSLFSAIPNSSFFRKGEVGDSKNYLTPEMETKIHQAIGLKLEGLGLYF